MKILVVMPTYNQSERIEYAVNSIINQTYKDWHLVIVDDASTDNTRFKLFDLYSDHPQITIVRNSENQGCYYSRNVGLKTAIDMGYEWDCHTVHDSDDVSSPERFERCIKPLENDGLWLLTTRYVRTYDQIKSFDEDFSIDRNSMGLGIGFYHRKIFEGIGYYDDTRFGGDSEYFERAIKYCEKTGKRRGMFDSKALYVAIYCDSNLTKTVSAEDREAYSSKYKHRHKISNDLYRGFKSNFKHIIVCRFNIPIGHGENSNNVEYVRYRLDILNKFMVPSLKAQTNKNFEFFLLCDLGGDVVEIVETELKDSGINIYNWTSHNEFNHYIKSKYCDYEHIMVSRIDSDDFYSSIFVEQVQSQYRSKPQVIDCRGYLQYKDNGFFRINKNTWSSPFCTLVIPTHKYKGIFHKKHSDWIDCAGDHYYDIDIPIATQVIHTGNVLNTFKHGRPIDKPDIYNFL